MKVDKLAISVISVTVGLVVIIAIFGVMGEDSRVRIHNSGFSPEILTVPAGTTVTWFNLDSSKHRVVSDTGLFDSGILVHSGNNDIGFDKESYSFKFSQPGNYSYHCAINPSMKGTIVVT
jgi:plastocyanin